MFHRWLGLAVVAAIAGAGSASADFRVRTSQDRVHFGEPVWFYVEIANPGPGELLVENPQCSRTRTRIELTAPDGKVLPMTGPSSCATTILEAIPPGASMLYAFELLEFYGADGGGALPYGILEPGPYRVRYRTGSAVSEDVAFTVERLDPADSATFHQYLDILARTSSADLPAAADRFREFATSHVDSPFAAALLCRAGVLSDLFFDSHRAMDDFRRLISLFPESGFVSVAVRHLAFGMGGDRTTAFGFLQTVTEDMPGTLAADFAARVIERIEALPPDRVSRQPEG